MYIYIYIYIYVYIYIYIYIYIPNNYDTQNCSLFEKVLLSSIMAIRLTHKS